MQKLEREFARDGLTLLGVTDEDPQEIKKFLAKEKWTTFTTVIDPGGKVGDLYQFYATPTLYFIGRDGAIRGKVIGTREWDSADGRAFLRYLLREPPRPRSSHR